MGYERNAAIIVYGTFLAGVTLWPGEPQSVESLGRCLICGRRGLADALLNCILFVPLGFLFGRRWLPAILVGGATSVAIEMLQLAVPGRHPNPGDILFNILGTAAGIGIGRTRSFWLRPPVHRGDALGTIAAVLAVLTMLLTAWLFQPDLPAPPYRVEWETDRPHLVRYPGTILAAGIQLPADDRPLGLRPGPTARGAEAKDLLERGALMGVIARAGPPTRGMAQLFGLYDREDRAVAILAVDSMDLVYREHTRASQWRLDNPGVQARGALAAVEPGDTVQLASARSGGRRCFLVFGELSCGHGINAASGWRLLYALNRAPRGVVQVLNGVWLALLLVPVGYWARWHLALGLAAVVAAYAAFRAPTETILVAVPPVELIGVGVGVAIGLLARRVVAGREVRNGPRSPTASHATSGPSRPSAPPTIH